MSKHEEIKLTRNIVTQTSGDWFDQMFQEYQQKGGFDGVPQGQKFDKDVLEGDIVDRMVKNANYRPEWVEVQLKIRESIQALLYSSQPVSKDLIKPINTLIKRYNTICPPIMQKSFLITTASLEEQFEQWK